MGYYTETFLANRREQWLRSIHAVEVCVDSTWYRGDLQTKTIEGDSIILMAVFSVLDAVAATINQSRIIDIRGEVAAQQAENITTATGQGTMFKIILPIREVLT